MFDKDKFAAHLDSQAPGTTSSYHCAKYVREALQAAGIDTQHHPIPAKDYGPYLEQWGFEPISPPSHPEKGDIAVIQPNPAGVRDGFSAEYGHIAAFDGHQWVSDFRQTNVWGGRKYSKDNLPIVYYRYVDKIPSPPTHSSNERLKALCPHCNSQLYFEWNGMEFTLDDPAYCATHGFICTRETVLSNISEQLRGSGFTIDLDLTPP